MSKFDDLVAQANQTLTEAEMPEGLKDGIGDWLNQLDQSHHDVLREVREQHAGENDAKLLELREVKRDLSNLQESFDRKLRVEVRHIEAAAKDELWGHADMRRLFELAHLQSPQETEMLLAYLGAHHLRGDLRDAKIERDKRAANAQATLAHVPV